MSAVIKVENLSKQYRLGLVGTGTIAHDLNRWWHRIRGNEDPYLKIGETNDRTVKGISEYVWALRDINFEVKQGDVLGIIGRNGAGKSTLLKILSRTTAPTTGNIKLKGRVASLLEVGTGFNPELSGRENIFLNGAILGMTKKEISRKFDEILDFAGVERYIDTPVKRYSSGMYVRLAFGVAAHLKSEILIVDEVLAVGDAEFQKKCLGKMKSVSEGEGRTVLFVSHNIIAMNALCKSGIVMEQGRIVFSGDIHNSINDYLLRGKDMLARNMSSARLALLENPFIKLLSVRSYSTTEVYKVNSEIKIEFKFDVIKPIKLNLSLILKNTMEVVIFNVASETKALGLGTYTSELIIPADLLNDDNYFVDIYFVDRDKITPVFIVKEVLSFNVEDSRDTEWVGKWQGAVRPKLKFTID